MDDATKSAYRFVIYWALLRVRGLQWISRNQSWIVSLFSLQKEKDRIRCAGEIAEWLHNAAVFSVHDFQGFSEDRFWKEYHRLREKRPNEPWDYRDVFENRLHECRTGKWPTIEEQEQRKAASQDKF